MDYDIAMATMIAQQPDAQRHNGITLKTKAACVGHSIVLQGGGRGRSNCPAGSHPSYHLCETRQNEHDSLSGQTLEYPTLLIWLNNKRRATVVQIRACVSPRFHHYYTTQYHSNSKTRSNFNRFASWRRPPPPVG